MSSRIFTLKAAPAAAWIGAIAAAAFAAAGPPARACTMKAVPLAVKMAGMEPIITAKLEGQDQHFLVDSGAFSSSINAQFALKQKMKPTQVGTTGTHMQVQGGLTVTGVANNATVSPMVQASEFNLGGIRFKAWNFLTFNGPEDPAGSIGQDVLRLLDVDYDLGHGSIKLMQVQDCKDANLAYWAAGQPVSVMPMGWVEQGNEHVVGTIIINGVSMSAYFDTGAEESFITETAAARAGVHVSDAGVRPSGAGRDIAGYAVKTWTALFSSVKIGDEEIKNTKLQIGRTDTVDFDVLLGADFFLAHHVYVSNSQKKIYFTYNGGQVFNVAAN